MNLGKIDELPEDALGAVFAYLAYVDLGRACQVCSLWRKVSESDFLWQSLCSQMWRNKANVTVGELYHRAIIDYYLCTAEECRQMLARRMTEGEDMPSTLPELVFALFKSESRLELVSVEFLGRFTRGKWKASFAYALVDCTRRRFKITKQELVEVEWTFFFKQQPLEFVAQARFTAEGRLEINPSPVRQPIEWTLMDHGAIQIRDFPRHRVSRQLDSWGFRIENVGVLFIQSNIPGFDLEREQRKLVREPPDYAYFDNDE
ncbi:hypothetical protein BASA81_006470 [Batrachochytrium salamandrivorans]|nr:hypothetical protein BASA81_006470 [Batrachochytrium salamandrivorans]